MKKINKKKDIYFQINSSRLNYLLNLYKMSSEDLLLKIKGSNKRLPITLDELNQILNNKNTKVNLSIIKKIDNFFQRGIYWYISKRELPSNEKTSIFFRKENFNSNLNYGSIKLIDEFERKRIKIGELCSNINYKMNRIVNYNLSDNPKDVAKEIRLKFDEISLMLKKKSIFKRIDSDRNFLENLIRIIEEFNVFVFEFVETWNKKDKVDFNGFFINPNLIVIKRQQNYFKREIFTLMHEFAHYLLEIEEIDENIEDSYNKGDIEKWCNEFAFYFLVNDYIDVIDKLDIANSKNNFLKEELEDISNKTRISKLSLYTKLYFDKKISKIDYDNIYKEIKNYILNEIEIKKNMILLENEEKKNNGEKIFRISPKSIESKLFKEIVKINYFEGKISQSLVYEFLNIKNKSFDEVIYS